MEVTITAVVSARARDPLLRYLSIDCHLCNPGLEYGGFRFRSVRMAYQGARYCHLAGETSMRPDLVAMCAIGGKWERLTGGAARRVGGRHKMAVFNVALDAGAWKATALGSPPLLRTLILRRAEIDPPFIKRLIALDVQGINPVERYTYETSLISVNLHDCWKVAEAAAAAAVAAPIDTDSDSDENW